jgi:hypothetical protein
MPTYTIKTYYFDELSREAQKRAYTRDQSAIPADIYNAEFRATLEAFEKIFNISVYRWDVSSNSFLFDFCQTAATNSDEINDPLRLATFVWNRYAKHIKKGKYYSTPFKYIDGKPTYKFRHSRVMFEMDNCPLTGVCWDGDILQPVIDCLEYRRFFDTFDDLITDCLNHFFDTWSEALKYSESFEFYEEEALANEWEYLADGTKWKGASA